MLFGGSGVEGVIDYADETATFAPSKPLRSGQWYWAFVDLDVSDEAGNRLEGSGAWFFHVM